MIQLSLEIPINYLSQFGTQTHYDFCLTHLAEQSPEYLNFYIKQANSGRLCILDNSVFELGHAVETSRIKNIYKQLNPNNFSNVVVIAPDEFGNGIQTIANLNSFTDEWIQDGSPSPRIMGVIQGKDLDDWLWCHDQLVNMVHMIGVPYVVPFELPEISSSLSKTKKQMFTRIMLFEKLLETNKLSNSSWYHLLGTSDPYELYYQSAISQIKSVDTSTPIVEAVFGNHFEAPGFLNHQNKCTRPADFFDIPYNEDTAEVCYRNIIATKMFCRGRSI